LKLKSIHLDEYEWKYDNCSLPSDEELVIYEIHVGDFSGDASNEGNERGTFTNVLKKIDYLKELGVNASMNVLFVINFICFFLLILSRTYANQRISRYVNKLN